MHSIGHPGTRVRNFKGYNDAYGFTEGDAVIELAAAIPGANLKDLAPSARLSDANLGLMPHPAQVGQAAAPLKSRVKSANAIRDCSGYLIDRRRAEPPAQPEAGDSGSHVHAGPEGAFAGAAAAAPSGPGGVYSEAR